MAPTPKSKITLTSAPSTPDTGPVVTCGPPAPFSVQVGEHKDLWGGFGRPPALSLVVSACRNSPIQAPHRSMLPLFRCILAALRRRFHLSPRPNFPGHLTGSRLLPGRSWQPHYGTIDNRY